MESPITVGDITTLLDKKMKEALADWVEGVRAAIDDACNFSKLTPVEGSAHQVFDEMSNLTSSPSDLQASVADDVDSRRYEIGDVESVVNSLEPDFSFIEPTVSLGDGVSVFSEHTFGCNMMKKSYLSYAHNMFDEMTVRAATPTAVETLYDEEEDIQVEPRGLICSTRNMFVKTLVPKIVPNNVRTVDMVLSSSQVGQLVSNFYSKEAKNAYSFDDLGTTTRSHGYLLDRREVKKMHWSVYGVDDVEMAEMGVLVELGSSTFNGCNMLDKLQGLGACNIREGEVVSAMDEVLGAMPTPISEFISLIPIASQVIIDPMSLFIDSFCVLSLEESVISTPLNDLMTACKTKLQIEQATFSQNLRIVWLSFFGYKGIAGWCKECLPYCYYVLVFDPGALTNPVEISPYLKFVGLHNVWEKHLGFHGFKACHVHGLYSAYFVWRGRVYWCCPICLAGVRKLLCPHIYKKVSRQFPGWEGSFNGGTFLVYVFMWDVQLWIFTLEDKGDSSTEDVLLGTRERMVIDEKMKSNLLLLPPGLTHDPVGLDDKVFLVQKLEIGKICRFSSWEAGQHGGYLLLVCAGHALSVQFVPPSSLDDRKEVGMSCVGYVFDPGGVCGSTLMSSQLSDLTPRPGVMSNRTSTLLSLQTSTLTFDSGVLLVHYQGAVTSVQAWCYSRCCYSRLICCFLSLSKPIEAPYYSETIFVFDPGGFLILEDKDHLKERVLIRIQFRVSLGSEPKLIRSPHVEKEMTHLASLSFCGGVTYPRRHTYLASTINIGVLGGIE